MKGKKRYLKEASVRDNLLGEIRGHTSWLRHQTSRLSEAKKENQDRETRLGLPSATQEQEGTFACPYPCTL